MSISVKTSEIQWDDCSSRKSTVLSLHWKMLFHLFPWQINSSVWPKYIKHLISQGTTSSYKSFVPAIISETLLDAIKKFISNICCKSCYAACHKWVDQSHRKYYLLTFCKTILLPQMETFHCLLVFLMVNKIHQMKARNNCSIISSWCNIFEMNMI